MTYYDFVELGLQVLLLIGTSSVVSAVIPGKYRNFIPLVGKVIDLISANVANAKNAK